MSSWVIAIGQDFRRHWDYARRDGVWDLKQVKPIKKDDILYFWHSGGSWVGRAIATSDVAEIDVTSVVQGPWDDWPGPPYRARFELRELGSPTRQPRWSEVTSDLKTKFNPSWFWSTDDPRSEAVLAGYFEPGPSLVELLLEATLDGSRDEKDDPDLGALDEDRREFRRQYALYRVGQDRYRARLLSAYGSCAITRVDVAEALEAAHIRPYSGPQSNVVTNGLLLRRDLHRLFDTHLLTVTRDYTVRVSPQLEGSEYWALDRTRIHLPARLDQRPAPDLLDRHGADCAWLGA